MAQRTASQQRQQEIARERSKAERKKPSRPSLVGLRVRDLNRLLTARYGEQLPNDDAGRDDVRIVCHHLAQYADGNPARRIASWIRLRAPWMTVVELEQLTVECLTKPTRWRADKLAWRMRLTEQDRQTLGITTIGAIDCGKQQRTKRRRTAQRKAKEAKRRAAGAKPRAEYEAASISATKPWEQLGISRRTWYRNGKPAPPA